MDHFIERGIAEGANRFTTRLGSWSSIVVFKFGRARIPKTGVRHRFVR